MYKLLVSTFLIALIGCSSTQDKKQETGKVYPLSEVQAMATPIVKVNPQNPPGELREGWVKALIIVNEEGRVTNFKVLNSNIKNSQAYENQALRSVSKWKYKPAIKDGKKVKVYREVIVDFKR